MPPAEAVPQELLRRACRVLGIVHADWVADYYRMPRRPYTSALHELVDAGELIPVRIDDWKADAFVHRDLADKLDDAAAGSLASTVTTVLSPFDPVVWDRKRASTLFGFDYVIECYTPAAKRKYGYFVLQILHRGRLIGQVDAKAHRTQGIFELKSLHIEPGVRVGTGLTADLRRALQRCADWHKTPQLAAGASVPAMLAAALTGES